MRPFDPPKAVAGPLDVVQRYTGTAPRVVGAFGVHSRRTKRRREENMMKMQTRKTRRKESVAGGTRPQTLETAVLNVGLRRCWREALGR